MSGARRKHVSASVSVFEFQMVTESGELGRRTSHTVTVVTDGEGGSDAERK